jgi:hypothetical protein
MSDWRDCNSEMSRYSIDDDTANRLLSGRLSPVDAPPGFAGLAGVVRSAAGPAAPAELARELDVVTAAVAAVRSVPSIRPSFRRRTHMLTKLLPAKVAALAATITIGAATAAAATGNLPNSAQTATSGALSHVGISIPKPNSHTSTENGKASMSGGTTANADFGQCNGFLAGSGSGSGSGDGNGSGSANKSSSAAFKDLIAAHGGTAQSAGLYCKGVLAAKTSSHDKSDGSANASGSMRATGPNGWGSGQGSLGGNVGPNGGSASGGGSAQPGPLPKPPTIPDPPKPPSVPNPASDDYGACTAFLAGQKAGGRVPGGVTGPSPKDSSAAFADLIAKHGGTVQSTTVYCDGVVAAPSH